MYETVSGIIPMLGSLGFTIGVVAVVFFTMESIDGTRVSPITFAVVAGLFFGGAALVITWSIQQGHADTANRDGVLTSITNKYGATFLTYPELNGITIRANQEINDLLIRTPSLPSNESLSCALLTGKTYADAILLCGSRDNVLKEPPRVDGSVSAQR